MTPTEITEWRSLVALREAFVRGAVRGFMIKHGATDVAWMHQARREAEELFPWLTEQPRTLTDHTNIEYRWGKDRIEWRYLPMGVGEGEPSEWRFIPGPGRPGGNVPVPTGDRIDLWADLKDNPTERKPRPDPEPWY